MILFILILLHCAGAIHIQFELYPHHRADVYFTMKFNNLAICYWSFLVVNSKT